MFEIHSMVEKRAKRMPYPTVETTTQDYLTVEKRAKRMTYPTVNSFCKKMYSSFFSGGLSSLRNNADLFRDLFQTFGNCQFLRIILN